ncbi:hypothetical protein [Serratia fonticola]
MMREVKVGARRRLLVLAMTMVLVTGPAGAMLSGSTGQIQGTVPTGAVKLQAMLPDGVTPVTNGTILGATLVPNLFTVSSVAASAELWDADDDTGFSYQIDIDGATLDWSTLNGMPLTKEQLAAPLGNNFAGETLSLRVSAPVTVTTTTGLPTTAGAQPYSNLYTVITEPVMAGVSVNGTTFAIGDGFPSTGFTGAEFILTVAGAASDYTWSSDASWAQVDSSGKVRFTAQGNASPVTITATPTGGGEPLAYTFTVGSWFINNGKTSMNNSDAANWCLDQGTGWVSPPFAVELSKGLKRKVGSLWSEWGNMANYSGSGFIGGYYWTAEAADIDIHYSIVLSNGGTSYGVDTDRYYVVCRQSL